MKNKFYLLLVCLIALQMAVKAQVGVGIASPNNSVFNRSAVRVAGPSRAAKSVLSGITPTESFYHVITLPYQPVDMINLSNSTAAPTIYISAISQSYPGYGFKVTLASAGTLTLNASSSTITSSNFAYIISKNLDLSTFVNMQVGNYTTSPLDAGTYYIALFTNNMYDMFNISIITTSISVAPSALSYPGSPVVATINTPVSASPTVTGTVDSYSINPALPAGLMLNSTTGVISGTPTVASNQTDYTVTATNTGGSATTTVTLTVTIAPTVTTQAVTAVTPTTATGNGNIISLGVPNPTSYGVCWNTTGTPTTSDSKVDNGAASVTGAFTASMTLLTPNTTYYVRAYATNAANTGYGTAVSFTTNPAVTVPSAGDGTSGNPYQIATLGNLNWLSQTPAVWDKSFIQTADIDASSTSTWFGGLGFSPIGNNSVYFSGNYNGQNYTINGLTINRPSTNYVGLFGYLVINPAISNIGLTNVAIIGHNYVGSLVGWNNVGVITNTYSTGSVKGNSLVGGLIGMNNSGIISSSFSNTNAEGDNNIGGLLGQFWGGSLSNSYATGSVTGTDLAGGLIGYFGGGSSVINCYAIGSVTGSTNVGGLIGFKETYPYVANSFWDTQTTGQAISAGGIGKTTVEMKAYATFDAAGWDFKGETKNGTNDIWNIGNDRNNGYPYFNWQYPTDPGFLMPTPTITSATYDALTGVLALSCTNITSGDVINPAKLTLTGESGTMYTLTTANVTASSSISASITLNSTDKVAINGLFNKNGTSSISAISYNLAAADKWNATVISENMADATTAVTVSNVTLPTVTTQAVNFISFTTATGNGNITNLGTSNPTEYGIVWSTTSGTETTTTYLGKTSQGAATVTGPFTSAMTDLTPGTTYYVKAYATNSAGTVYGSEVSFTALKVPTVTTQAVTGISPTTGIGNGNITDLGYPNATYGVVWSKSTSPTTTSKVGMTVQGPASVTGAFTSYMTGLYPNTKYYVRTYATNTAGTVYGSEVSFTTPNTPEASTQAVTGITPTSAIGNGTIIDLGNPTATKYGMVWSTHEYPTTDENKTEIVGGSVGTFTSAITGLTPNTKYYVRAYVTNSIGTNYGGELVSFTTLLSTGLNQTGLLNVEIYPNPTSEGIYVNAGESVAALSLCDLSSRILLVKQLIGNTYVNIGQFDNGVYIAKISTQSGTLEKKIIKK